MGIFGTDIDLGGASQGLGGLGGGGGNTAIIVVVFLFFIILSGAGAFFIYKNKEQKKEFMHHITIFKDYNGQRLKIGEDWAKEVFIKGTNVSLFYLGIRKMYMPRPTRVIGRNEYYFCILKNGEWLNFNIGKFAADEAVATPGYDHRDTRYAYLNLQEIIKRNYKDKAKVWWKEFAHIISFIIIVFVFTIAIIFITVKLTGAIEAANHAQEQWVNIANSLANIVEGLRGINSGVVNIG